MVLPDTVSCLTVYFGPSRTASTTRAVDVLILVARFIDLRRQETLLAVVALEKLGDDDRVGEELALEFLLVHDLVELIWIDPGRTLEREDHFLRPWTGLNVEHHSALAVRDVLNLVVDLGLKVVVGHQPLPQRIRAVVGPLFVEDAAMPLRADLVLNLLRRRRAHELQIDARSERHVQFEVCLVGLDPSLEADARLEIALLDE